MDPTPLPAANGAPGISHFGPAATEIEREKLVAPALVGGLKGSIVVVQKPSLDDAFEAPETVDSAAAGIVQVVQPEADAAPDVSIEEVPLTVHQPPSDTEAADEPHGHGTVTRSSLFDPEATGGPQRRHTHAGASEQYLVPIVTSLAALNIVTPVGSGDDTAAAPAAGFIQPPAISHAPSVERNMWADVGVGRPFGSQAALWTAPEAPRVQAEPLAVHVEASAALRDAPMQPMPDKIENDETRGDVLVLDGNSEDRPADEIAACVSGGDQSDVDEESSDGERDPPLPLGPINKASNRFTWVPDMLIRDAIVADREQRSGRRTCSLLPSHPCRGSRNDSRTAASAGVRHHTHTTRLIGWLVRFVGKFAFLLLVISAALHESKAAPSLPPRLSATTDEDVLELAPESAYIIVIPAEEDETSSDDESHDGSQP
jgi:hypothetical protein